MQSNAAIDSPSQHGQARKLGIVIENDSLGIAAYGGDDVEHPNDALSAQ